MGRGVMAIATSQLAEVAAPIDGARFRILPNPMQDPTPMQHARWICPQAGESQAIAEDERSKGRRSSPRLPWLLCPHTSLAGLFQTSVCDTNKWVNVDPIRHNNLPSRLRGHLRSHRRKSAWLTGGRRGSTI